jgi:hypothetical protein
MVGRYSLVFANSGELSEHFSGKFCADREPFWPLVMLRYDRRVIDIRRERVQRGWRGSGATVGAEYE